jgi:1-acyl-sn-glycerol-3-phosphate acyltransferase
VGFICKKAKVPVIAAKVSGTEKVFPKGAKFPRLGRIKVTFKKVDNIAADDTYEDITQKVIAAIKSL